MIEGVDHIGIAVVSIAEARVFYESLGLEVAEIEEVPQEKVRVAMIPCGGTRIELIEATDPESAIARFIASKGPGIHHVCLRSDDIEKDDSNLREGGYRVLREQPTVGAEGALVQWVHPRSTGGVLTELSQPTGEGHH
jgi:methylmalonyl-CoA/ethylmalonyl-CoA epimerase